MPEQQEDPEQQRLRKAMTQRIKALQIEQQKRSIAQRFMEPDAYERLMNVRVANYELYSKLLDLIISTVQSNQIGAKITDAQLKQILSKMSYRPESNIEFKHK